MDEKDYKIVELLRRDARTTNNAIAEQVGLTEGAVRNRIGRLVRDDVIRRFTIETGPELHEAIVLMKTRTKSSKEILRRIRKCADRLFETAGDYDVAAFLSAESMERINSVVDRLRAVDGVTATVTLLKIADEE
ncbi:MAG TPA: Lrp/AsnC family transcriptional regulator [Candidatus Bathyarchaeia archaeon]|nr:Lrp/AsnC family transcriptional regulator [Candidatus Bathyarchaeia archaeon]